MGEIQTHLVIVTAIKPAYHDRLHVNECDSLTILMSLVVGQKSGAQHFPHWFPGMEENKARISF